MSSEPQDGYLDDEFERFRAQRMRGRTPRQPHRRGELRRAALADQSSESLDDGDAAFFGTGSQQRRAVRARVQAARAAPELEPKRVEVLEERIKELLGFARHEPTCVAVDAHGFDESACDCGFAEVVQRAVQDLYREPAPAHSRRERGA